MTERDDTSALPSYSPPAPKASQKKSNWTVLSLFALTAALAGIVLIVSALLQKDPAPAPLPSHVFSLPSVHPEETPTSAPISTIPAAVAPCDIAPTPGYLTIQSHCIKAKLLSTKATNGTVAIPLDVAQVAIDTDTAPLHSTTGSSLIVGHVDDYNQGSGALYHLSDIAPLATITTWPATDPAPSTWMATSLTVYPKYGLPTSVFSKTGPHRLTLITCGGAIMHTSTGYHYADNVVVTAVRTSTQTATTHQAK